MRNISIQTDGFMLKKYLQKILPGRERGAERRVLPLSEHGISVGSLSPAAERVVSRLQKAGFETYIVGGAVRDLLTGGEPKDFDVATSARPEQIRKLFGRSRIVGKRFPIVHVMVGQEQIEVTTFRSASLPLRQNEHGRIMQDNRYGTLPEDALRRDFTCNALYYNPANGDIIDFHGGADDVYARRLVMIGDAAERYQEDPVRMLRAARLSGKLGFQVASETAAAMADKLHLLSKEPAARLFDETMKIMLSGAAADCLYQLRRLGMDTVALYPLLDEALAALPQQGQTNVLSQALAETDRRIRDGLSVSAGFVAAAVLWPRVSQHWRRLLSAGGKPDAALQSAVAAVIEQTGADWGVPQRHTAAMRDILLLQARFAFRRGARPFRLSGHHYFRAAYDFLLLRARCGEDVGEEAGWWTDFLAASEAQRIAMVQQQDAAANKPRRKKKPSAAEREAG